MSFETEVQRGWGRGMNSNQSQPSYQNSQPTVVVEDEYMQTHHKIFNDIKQMTYNYNLISQSNQQIGSEKDTQEFRDQLIKKIEATRIISRDTTQLIKKMDKISTGTPQEQKDKKRVILKITKDFESFDEKFRLLSREANEKMHQHDPKPLKPKFQPKSDSFYDDDDDEKSNLIEAERRQQEFVQLENEREFMDNLIVDRDQEIKVIQSQMTEVNEMFKDLAQLVSLHGEMIDNIETNIEVAKQSTTKAVTEVKKASDYQQRSRNKLCLVLLIITVILAIIIGIVIWRTSS